MITQKRLLAILIRVMPLKWVTAILYSAEHKHTNQPDIGHRLATNECGGGYGWLKVYPGRRECGRDTAEIPTSVDALGDRGRNN